VVAARIADFLSAVYRYEIAAAALPRESVAENNTALSVVRRPIHAQAAGRLLNFFAAR
jgi:hypothetical protein